MKLIQETSLTAIADAIREKTETTNLLTLGQMPQAILDIKSGGSGDFEDGEKIRW